MSVYGLHLFPKFALFSLERRTDGKIIDLSWGEDEHGLLDAILMKYLGLRTDLLLASRVFLFRCKKSVKLDPCSDQCLVPIMIRHIC